MRHCAPLSLYFVHFPALRSCLAFALADAHSLSFSASIDARRIHDDWAHNKNGKTCIFLIDEKMKMMKKKVPLLCKKRGKFEFDVLEKRGRIDVSKNSIDWYQPVSCKK